MSIYTKETLEQPINFLGQIIKEVNTFDGKSFNGAKISLSDCQGYAVSITKDRKRGFYSSVYAKGTAGILLPEFTDDVTDEDIETFIYAVGKQMKKDEV
ncbi:hypothetical protein P4679_24330 [Priestia megaterium]|uniref:hypothetical protein n=1 Tax=Priestia megaterium TaxID=1404 RepID=UPI002E1BBBDA|nr:hypothetical protein [Priestia megaterium]